MSSPFHRSTGILFVEHANMPRRTIAIGLALCACAGLLPGCEPQGAAPLSTGASAAPTAARAMVLKPERKLLVRTIDLPGRVEPIESAPLYAKATGYVVKIPVDIGDVIKGPQGDTPGTLLCELQVPELNEERAEKIAVIAQLNAEVQQADAGVALAEAAVKSAESRVLEAQAAVARDEARYQRWKSEYERVSQLVESGAVNRKVADETRSELDAADAGRQEVTARIAAVQSLQAEASAAHSKAKADAVATRARLAVAEAEERRVAAMLEYTSIRAPFDGMVVMRNVHTGHLVQAGGVNGGQPLLEVMRTDPVRVTVDIPEGDALRVTPQTRAHVSIPALPGAVYTGTVTRSSWSLNTSSRTLTAEIDVPNPDGRWRPGSYVQVALTVAETSNSLSLPRAAIVTQDKQTWCFAVDDDSRVTRLPVVLGLQAGGDVEILQGLSGDERVIAVNAASFRIGQEVEAAEQTKPDTK